MADSEVEIANLALLKIGASASLIGDFDDESDEAAALKLLYPQNRDSLLLSFKWPWAQRRAYPVPLGGEDWSSTEAYDVGDFVTYVPDSSNVVNAPELVSSFVYLSLTANNQGNTPDSSAGNWLQVSRAAWGYCYVLPGDVLQVHDIYKGIRNPREDQHIAFELGYEAGLDAEGNSLGPGTLLFTDAKLPWEARTSDATPPAIEIAYTAIVKDPKAYPPHFTDVLAWDIAEDLCLSIRKDAAEADRCAKASTAAFGKATASARLSVRRDNEPVPSWIAARRTARRPFTR